MNNNWHTTSAFMAAVERLQVIRLRLERLQANERLRRATDLVATHARKLEKQNVR